MYKISKDVLLSKWIEMGQGELEKRLAEGDPLAKEIVTVFGPICDQITSHPEWRSVLDQTVKDTIAKMKQEPKTWPDIIKKFIKEKRTEDDE